MNVLIQPEYYKYIKNEKAAHSFKTDLPSGWIPEIVIGDQGYIAKHKNALNSILIVKDKNFTFTKDQILPYRILQEQPNLQIDTILDELNEFKKTNDQILKIKSEIQSKRKELELLNEKLNLESEQQILSLEQSHLEETQKNLKEKSLLHFLDFIQSESTNEEFLISLLRFVWKDLKKFGNFYQIGFSFKMSSDKSTLLTYDGKTENNTVVSTHFKSTQFKSQLATIWGRPVGKISHWSLSDFSKEAFLFVEIVDQRVSMAQLENYITDRLDVMSLYLDRWMIEKEYSVTVERWNRTFDSFSGYTHVIDDQFNLFQSNYSKSKNTKCYQALANRQSPCVNCPVISSKSTELVIKDGVKVKTYFSEFKFNSKKYYFVIYEDVTQLHLLQSQIIQSDKMSAIGRLGNHLAHELNNPLTGLKSYLQSLLQDPQANLGGSLVSDLSEVLKATERCQRIIKSFIDFSHKPESKLEKVVFAEVLKNTLMLLKSALRPHRLFVDMKETQILANSHDLQQVLFNLIKNSCQAMADGGTVKIYEEEQNGKIYFNIHDTGPGFNEEILQNVFQPFMTTKKKGEGTGLGLYLSKKMMKNMNADLSVTSKPGQGAKISLIFDKV